MKDFYIASVPATKTRSSLPTSWWFSNKSSLRRLVSLYLALTLGDRSGQLEAKMWTNGKKFSRFRTGRLLKIKGLVNKYKNRFQLTIHSFASWAIRKLNSPITFPKPRENIDELWQSLTDFVSSFQNSHLQALVRASCLTRKSRQPIATPPPPKRCITPISADCSIMWSRFSLLRPDLPKLFAGQP